MPHYIALDIGGSHITAGLVDIQKGKKRIKHIFNQSIDSNASADHLLETISDCIVAASKQGPPSQKIKGIGISMPGPFDYKNGISRIAGVNKFDS
jgi:glucokinase